MNCGGVENLDDGENIVQIIPADGWKAIYLWRGALEKDAIGVLSLVCWALVEGKDRKRNIFGVTATSDGLLGLQRKEDEFYMLLGPLQKVEEIRDQAMTEWRRRIHE